MVLVQISLESHSFRRLTEEMDRGRQRQCRPRVWRSAAYFHMMDVLGSMTMRVVEERERDHWSKLFGSSFISLPLAGKPLMLQRAGQLSPFRRVDLLFECWTEREREIRVDVAERRGARWPSPNYMRFVSRIEPNRTERQVLRTLDSQVLARPLSDKTEEIMILSV